MKRLDTYLRVCLASMCLFCLAGCQDGDSHVDPADFARSDSPNVIVIFTDDQGFADLGVQGQSDDIQTPNIDKIAARGARFTNGYVTAPQCKPSRAGLISGQYQQRFGLDDHRFTPMPLDVITLGQRFLELDYATGMVGKWHLEVDWQSHEWLHENFPDLSPEEDFMSEIPLSEKRVYFPDRRGYQDTYFGYHREYWATFDRKGNSRPASYIKDRTYRVDAVSNAAVKFIERHWQRPFYLHVAHFAPHVPLVAAQRYLDRFPNDMEMRRKYALAMMSAIDDGVGAIMETLEEFQISGNTLVFFVSDNGAPLGLDMTDAPISDNREPWDGSLNTPLVGEKGMLTDGGIRVPFLWQWPDRIPPGVIIDKPVSVLDIAATSLNAAGSDDVSDLDGIDLLPAMLTDDAYLDERALYWRFWQQAAVRQGKWKYLRAGSQREYLFDMESDLGERENRILAEPERTAALKAMLAAWEKDLLRTVELRELDGQEKVWFDYFLKQH